MCGTCLVGSTEVIRKLPDHERLPDGYGCVAIEDVQDIEALSARLAAIARDPAPIASVAARGRAFARAAQADTRDPDRLEQLLKAAGTQTRFRQPSAAGGRRRRGSALSDHPARGACAGKMENRGPAAPPRPSGPIDLPQRARVLAAAERGVESGDLDLRSVASAIRLEIAIVEAETAPGPGSPHRASIPCSGFAPSAGPWPTAISPGWCRCAIPSSG